MASAVTAWTFNELPAIEAGKFILSESFNDADFSPLVGHDEIIAKEQIPFLGQFGIAAKAAQGCGKTRTSEDLPSSEKFWDPEKIGIYKTFCGATYEKEITAYLKNKGLRSTDLTGSVLWDWFSERMGTLVKEEVLRTIWFGDKTAANYNDSPAGVITNGVDNAYFTVIDGLWKQLFAIAAGNAARRYTITKNSGNSYANQALAAGDSVTIFEGLWAKADMRLRNAPNKVLVVTQSIADNYRTFLTSKGVTESFSKIENGTPVLRWNGITITEQPFHDRMIDSYQNNGTVWNIPHRAVLTTLGNLVYGTDSLTDFGSFKAFYDMYHDENIMDAEIKLDAKVLENHMIEVAY